MGKVKGSLIISLLLLTSCVERFQIVEEVPPVLGGRAEGVWVLTTLSPELWYVEDSSFRVMLAGRWANDLTLAGDTLYITNSGDNNVLRYAMAEGRVDTLYVGPDRNPWASAYDPRTGRLFVSNFLGSTVSVFVGTTLEAEVPVGPNPEGIAVLGDRVFVACTGYSEGYRSRLYVLSADSLKVLDSLIFGTNVQAVVPDPEGDIYAVATGDYSSREGWLFRVRDGRVADSLFVGGTPGDACISSDGILYLVGWDGRITLYDWAAERVVGSYDTGLNLMGCGFKGDTLTVADFGNDRLLLIRDGEVVGDYPVGDGPIDVVPDVR
ncbi:MAG: hypothetical protein GXO29_06015 [Thermotogae bacterium]|nr:hypothetical protein [Thermotogota bacterium]